MNSKALFATVLFLFFIGGIYLAFASPSSNSSKTSGNKTVNTTSTSSPSSKSTPSTSSMMNSNSGNMQQNRMQMRTQTRSRAS